MGCWPPPLLRVVVGWTVFRVLVTTLRDDVLDRRAVVGRGGLAVVTLRLVVVALGGFKVVTRVVTTVGLGGSAVVRREVVGFGVARDVVGT